VIEICNLTKHYGRKVAIEDLSLQVNPGEVFAFLGPNGAGKTTTIKILAGLLRPTGGSARVCGHDVVSNALHARACLSCVPDQPYLYEKLTGREFLQLVADLYDLDREAAARRSAELSERFEVQPFLDDLTENYSHGMKQRVVLTAAMLHDPQVLVVDEPMVGLDPRSARTVKETFRELADRGRTVFVSTHTLSLAEQIADRIGIINKGRLSACGTLDELRQQRQAGEGLEDLFLALTSGT
jgi:ABC-2 type transport system ATP-binding protein